VSEFTDPAAWIVEQERRGEFEEESSQRELFESVYYLTFQFLPPADRSSKAESWIIETRSSAKPISDGGVAG